MDKNLFSVLIFGFFSLSQFVLAHTPPEYLTIYVHGTTTALGLRLISRFCKDVSFGELGIHHIDKLQACNLLRQDALLLQKGDSKRFDVNHFYTFGWSGKLSFKARQKAGFQLYQDIQKLLLEYKKKYGYFPKVQILTFSHGGNVALNMVKSLPFFQDQKVDLELVIVACPVQKVTEPLIEHECIDRSYVISSSRDLLQVVDCYYHEKKWNAPERFFKTSKQNCHQVKVMINDRGLGHIDLMRSFMIHLPYVLNFLDQNCGQQPRILPEIFGSVDCKPVQADTLECCILDPEFRFYNVFNLVKVVKGQRKKPSLKSRRCSSMHL